VFLSWQGFNSTIQYQSLKDLGESLYYHLYTKKSEEITKENNTRHSLHDIAEIAKKYNMEVLYGLEYYKVSAETTGGKIKCEYKYQPYDLSPKDFFPSCQMVIANRE